MIIAVMDLLYINRFDGFCLVSSDSDFTRLASRIRESGLVVYGFGERKTPKPFIYFNSIKQPTTFAPIAPIAPIEYIEPSNGIQNYLSLKKNQGKLRINQPSLTPAYSNLRPRGSGALVSGAERWKGVQGLRSSMSGSQLQQY